MIQNEQGLLNIAIMIVTDYLVKKRAQNMKEECDKDIKKEVKKYKSAFFKENFLNAKSFSEIETNTLCKVVMDFCRLYTYTNLRRKRKNRFLY